MRGYRARLVMLLAATLTACGGGDSSPPGEITIASIEIVAGDGQDGVVGAALPEQLVVRVIGSDNEPLAYVPVGFEVVAGAAEIHSPLAATDVDGHASTRLTLGTAVGTISITATVPTNPTYSVLLTVHATPDQPSLAVVVSGDGQYGDAGTQLSDPVIIEVRDRYGNPVPGHQVDVAVLEGSGNAALTSSVTDADGRVAVVHTLGFGIGIERIRAFLVSAPAIRVEFMATISHPAYVIVGGFDSDNIVRFRLDTGSWEEVVMLNATDRPRGVAVDAQGRIYVGLRGGTQNVRYFEWDGTPIGDFTSSISGYGPGIIAFDGVGDLIVAGDVSDDSSVFRYSATGSLIDSFNTPDVRNVVGLAVDGTDAYSADLFSGEIVRYDLTQSPVTGTTVVSPTTLIDDPVGLAIGHTGNLFVTSTKGTAVQEFDVGTGALVGTFVDLSSLGLLGSTDLTYDPLGDRYFIAAGDSAYEFDSSGNLLVRHQSGALVVAYGIAFVPAAQP